MRDHGVSQMTAEEIDSYLGRQPRSCAFASLRNDGSPIVTPLGYLYEGGYIHVSFAPGSNQVKRLRRDPRVSITVSNDHFPVQYVIIVGTAEEVPDPDLELALRKHRWIMQLAEDWLDQDEFERSHFAAGRVVFRVAVTADNVAASDLRKATLPVLAGATRPSFPA